MRLFHVERTSTTVINKGRILFLTVLLTCFSCATMRDRDTIPDYVIKEGGMTLPGSPQLNAFLFEDVRQDNTFQGFLVYKFKQNNLDERTFKVTLSNSNFRILYYDNFEFEKFFRASNFIPTVTVTAEQENQNKPRFIAISMVDDTNQDCLTPASLWYTTATTYLKTLKDEYLANARP